MTVATRRETRRRGCPSALLVLAASLLASCCGRAPAVSRYFDRSNSLDALRGFVYSVETGDWDYAFASLDHASRSGVETPLRLRLAVALEKEPVFGIPVEDLILESIAHRTGPFPVRVSSGSAEYILLDYMEPDPETQEDYSKIQFRVFLVFEEREWRIDLGSTLAQWSEIAGS